jgi:hypothetical protein
MSQPKSDQVTIQIKHRTHGGTIERPTIGKEYDIVDKKKKKTSTTIDLEKIDGLDYITG